MLILPIKKKWFDMILSGEKNEEYREIKPYYESRLQSLFGAIIVDSDLPFPTLLQGKAVPEEIRKDPVQKIMFRNGYSASSPSFIARCKLRLGNGKTEWGAELGKNYFILEIVEIVQIRKGEERE